MITKHKVSALEASVPTHILLQPVYGGHAPLLCGSHNVSEARLARGCSGRSFVDSTCIPVIQNFRYLMPILYFVYIRSFIPNSS